MAVESGVQAGTSALSATVWDKIGRPRRSFMAVICENNFTAVCALPCSKLVFAVSEVSEGHTSAVVSLLPECLHDAESCYFYEVETDKGSPYSITERRVPELIPVLGSQPAGDANHKPDGRLPLLSARLAITPATIKRAATNFAAW